MEKQPRRRQPKLDGIRLSSNQYNNNKENNKQNIRNNLKHRNTQKSNNKKRNHPRTTKNPSTFSSNISPLPRIRPLHKKILHSTTNAHLNFNNFSSHNYSFLKCSIYVPHFFFNRFNFHALNFQ